MLQHAPAAPAPETSVAPQCPQDSASLALVADCLAPSPLPDTPQPMAMVYPLASLCTFTLSVLSAWNSSLVPSPA